MEELTLELPSGRVAAEVRGEGPLVVCVHGLSANLRCFDSIADRLQDGHRVVAVDLRGRACSQVTPPGSYGLASHAADVIAIANALEAETFDYVGWSMGALIGILLASLGAGRLHRLVLIDHAGGMDEAALQAVRDGLARLDVDAGEDDYVEMIRARSAIENWQPMWEAMYRREHGRTSRAACEEDLEGGVQLEWKEAWRTLTMPTLLLRCARPLNGGFIVPEAERDALMATAARGSTLDVDANHFDVMTADAAIDAIAAHLA